MGAVVTLDPAPCNQTMTVDIRNKHDRPYQLALYFVDWEKAGRRSAVEVFDLDDKRLLMPVQIVRDYREGRYVVLSLEGSVRLRINQVRERTHRSARCFSTDCRPAYRPWGRIRKTFITVTKPAMPDGLRLLASRRSDKHGRPLAIFGKLSYLYL
ncbi:MAG: hypothetical protein ACLR76_05505 [Alistipes sp.]